MKEKTEQDRKKDRKNKTADIAKHQIGILIKNAQAVNQSATTVKRKVTSRKFADQNLENKRILKKLRDQMILEKAIPTNR